ncbi:MAG: hypothetical protein NZ903_01050 [Candidatus Micrarchaeota archaeon]|nr:hypothetical protein [Candidatus Micrarchaeota archaeon]
MEAAQLSKVELKEEIERIKGLVEKIAEKKPADFNLKDLDNSKGAFFIIPLIYNDQDFKKKLLRELYEFSRKNSYHLVFRIGMYDRGEVLFVNKSYATEIHFFLPEKEIIQSFVNEAIRKKKLDGKGKELYANPTMGFIALVNEGKVEEVAPLSGSSISVQLKTGRFTLGPLEKGSWFIPDGRVKDFELIAKSQKYSSSFLSPKNPKNFSIYNLMGSAKMSFHQTEKLHFRTFIYPGYRGEIPVGSEAGIIDDIYNQTTAGCLFIGEGSFYVVKKGEGFLLGADIKTREKDIGMLIKNGEVQLEELPIGTQLRMRNGKYATLSEDKYGNKVWLDENGYYVPFDSISFDWDAEDMPQVIWKPPEYGKSKFINAQTAGRNLYIDIQSYYIMEKEDSIQVVVYPDRYGIAEANRKVQLFHDFNSLIKQRELKIVSDQSIIDNAFQIAKIVPVSIFINISR